LRKIPKLARSKFDRFKYRNNVARFDHFCGWVYNTIGEENYRFFLLFLVVHVCMCCYGTYVLSMLFYAEIVLDKKLLEATFVDRFTGQEFAATKWVVVQYMLHNYMYESGVLLLMGVMTVALALFLGYHVYLTSVNMTTNEAYKWGHVKQWYKKALKRYEKAVANGNGSAVRVTVKESPANRDGKRPPQVTGTENRNGDVTPCPPVARTTTATADQVVTPGDDDDDDDDCHHESKTDRVVDAVRHPGPKPRNIYDRGFIENWKEVLFPISLRTDQSSVQWNNLPSRKTKTF
jgi:palmitoyltransferase